MKRLTRKVAVTLVCTALAVGSVFAANAISIDDKKDFELTGETIKVGNNQVLVAATGYNENTPKNNSVMFESLAGKEYSMNFRDCTKAPKMLNLPKNQSYYYWTVIDLHSSSTSKHYKYQFDNTNGEYVRVRIKVSDFSRYFNEDGTITRELDDGTPHVFDWTFKDFGNKNPNIIVYHETSSLIVKSGVAVTSVVPDKNGYAELYVSKKIGDITNMSIDTYYVGKDGRSCSIGTSRQTLVGLVRGDVSKNDYVTVEDATTLQKYVVGDVKFDKLQLFNGDVNDDGEINVVDATLVQKHIVGLDS